MADVDTSNQKHKGKAEQNKAGTERHLQEDMQRLDEAIRDNAYIEKNCKITQGSIATANPSLVNIERSVNDVDIVKKKVTVEQDDLNIQIEEIETAIKALSKAQADIQLWKSKFEVAACEKIEELRFLDKWKVKAVHLALELEAVRSEAATEDSIDQLNIVRRYGLSPSNNFVINKYFYLVQGEPEHG